MIFAGVNVVTEKIIKMDDELLNQSETVTFEVKNCSLKSKNFLIDSLLSTQTTCSNQIHTNSAESVSLSQFPKDSVNTEGPFSPYSSNEHNETVKEDNEECTDNISETNFLHGKFFLFIYSNFYGFI